MKTGCKTENKSVGSIEDLGGRRALLIASGKPVLMRNHRGCSQLLCPSCRWKGVRSTVTIRGKSLGANPELNPTSIHLPIQCILSLGHTVLSKGPEIIVSALEETFIVLSQDGL